MYHSSLIEEDQVQRYGNIFIILYYMNEVIQEATSKCSQKKTVSPHSKPYWTKKLTELSKTLIAAQKRYTKRNTDDNHAAFKLAYEELNALRKKECQQFILKKTSIGTQCISIHKVLERIQ